MFENPSSQDFEEAVDPNLVADVMSGLRCIPNLTIEPFNVGRKNSIPY